MPSARSGSAGMRVNRRRWNEVVAIHASAPSYDLEGFRRGRLSLHSLERDEVGPVRGRRLLHLQCHFGLDTLSWARLGADVTGVDYSPAAIGLARSLAAELHIPATFVESNLYRLRRSLRGKFDIVYVSYGAINWLPDLRKWAQIIASYLQPGGAFYMVEGHPAAGVFDDERKAGPLHVIRPYFPGAAPTRFVTPGDYADFTAKVRNKVTYEWGHPIGEVVSELARAGLRIEFLHEFPFCAWRAFPFMKKGKDGWWRMPAGMPSLPLMFSVRARAPLRARPRNSRERTDA